MSVRDGLMWQERAACAGYPTAWFFPHKGQDRLRAAAMGVCQGCAVRVDCLEYALSTQQPHYDMGVWGGATGEERTKLRRRRCSSCRGPITAWAQAVQYVADATALYCERCAVRPVLRCIVCGWEGEAGDYVEHWRVAHPAPGPRRDVAMLREA